MDDDTCTDAAAAAAASMENKQKKNKKKRSRKRKLVDAGARSEGGEDGDTADKASECAVAVDAAVASGGGATDAPAAGEASRGELRKKKHADDVYRERAAGVCTERENDGNNNNCYNSSDDHDGREKHGLDSKRKKNKKKKKKRAA